MKRQKVTCHKVFEKKPKKKGEKSEFLLVPGKTEVVDADQDFISQKENDEAQIAAEREANAYKIKRNEERGSIASQLEFIVENGIDAFIQRDLDIRARHPKPEPPK